MTPDLYRLGETRVAPFSAQLRTLQHQWFLYLAMSISTCPPFRGQGDSLFNLSGLARKLEEADGRTSESGVMGGAVVPQSLGTKSLEKLESR